MRKRSISKVLTLLLLVFASFIFLTACNNVEFKISFMVDNKVYDTLKTDGKSVVSMPENPTKDGYLFDGWYWDEDEWTTPFTANSLLDAPLSSDMSVYAKFVYDTTSLTESYLVNSLKDMPNVLDAQTVNEYNDPNNLLGKDGCYTICVYFSLDVIDQNQVYGNDLINKGTEAGGCIEVFENIKDAETRNTYLSAFDGTILATGSHKVFGTCVIRTSNILKASLQKIVESNITKILKSSSETFESLDTNLINLAKQYAEEDLLSKYETATKLMELGYPYDKSEQIADLCGINWINHAKLKTEYYSEYYATVSPSMITDLLLDHEFEEDEISEALTLANVDWGFYSKIQAEEYILMMEDSEDPITPNGLLVYLCWDKGYIDELSEYSYYALENIDVNWNQKALEYVAYLDADGMAFGPKIDYVNELLGLEFTQSQMQYAINNCDNNWNEHALICLKHFIEDLSNTPQNYSQCNERLESWGFSNSEINYAINNYDGLIYPDNLNYVITLNVTYGSVPDYTIDVIYGQSFTLPIPTSTRDGYEFDGWYYNGVKYNDGIWKTASNITLTANWKEIVYTIEYRLNGGTNNSYNKTSYKVTDVVLLWSPRKTGYTFTGWTYDGQETPILTLTLEKGTIGNKILIANWSAKTYTITFNANGGDCSLSSDIATYDSNFDLPTPARVGYEFTGWYYSGNQYNSGVWKTDMAITLSAIWEEIEYNITYNLDGGVNHLSNPKTYNITQSKTIYAPTKTGYNFTGWTYDGQETPILTLTLDKGTTGNKILIANWNAKTYTITFNANGGSCSTTSDSATYDSYFPLPTPTKEGYNFVGWYNGTTKYESGIWKTASEISLKAEWVARDDINYIVNHYQENINDANYTLFETQTLQGTTNTYVEPTRNNYTGFVKPETQSVKIKADGSLIVNYYYTRVLSTISFHTNGGNKISSITAKFGTSITLPTAEKGEMTFGGWWMSSWFYEKADYTTMPAYNRQVFARWLEETDPKELGYDFYDTDGMVITGYTGTSSTLWIPTHIYGKPVVQISEKAFKDNTTITKVVIPDNVQYIGLGAFKGCDNIEDMVLPFIGCDELTTENYKQVFGYIFDFTTSLNPTSIFDLYKTSSSNYTEQSVYINPSSGYHYVAYYYIPRSLKNVTITKQTKIPENAFRNCNLIEKINLPVETSEIGSYAFYNCEKLSSFNLNDDGYSVLPIGLTSISIRAFGNNKSLTNMIIPENITEIQDYAFIGCSSLTTINYAKSSLHWHTIIKAENWAYNSAIKTIICSDMTISAD